MSIEQDRKKLITNLLKGIETGDTSAVWVVNEEKYIQHNPETHEGSEGLAELFKRLSKTSPQVNIVRIFEDGEYIFAHTEYDFQNSNIGFEIFRFEDGLAVEHWDNIQRRQSPNTSGRSMVDGRTEVTDQNLTESNRKTVKHFLNSVLIDKNIDQLHDYIDDKNYCEHNPELTDNLEGLGNLLTSSNQSVNIGLHYQTIHRVLAEGCFVLSVCEGFKHGDHVSFFDLFYLNNGKVIEHWDTVEKIPDRSLWKNDNGKF